VKNTLSKLQTRGAQAADLIGDHLRFAHTCPSIETPNEIPTKSQAKATNEKSPENGEKRKGLGREKNKNHLVSASINPLFTFFFKQNPLFAFSNQQISSY